MKVYADSSVLVSLYIRDAHTAAAREWLSRMSASPLLTPLHVAEWTNALAQHVFRGRMTASQMQRVYENFTRDLDDAVWQNAPLPDGTLELCATLARRYTPKLGTRTLDTLHIACASLLDVDIFKTFDERQQRLAEAIGLSVAP